MRISNPFVEWFYMGDWVQKALAQKILNNNSLNLVMLLMGTSSNQLGEHIIASNKW